MKKTFTTYEKLCKLPLGWSLWGLLFFFIFMLSCTNDVAEVGTSSQQEQYVTVRMNVPRMQTSISRAADGEIESVTALAYDSNNKLTKIVSATNLMQSSFNITVPNGTTTIHFLGNNTVSLPEIGTDVSALTSLTTTNYNDLVYWGMATYDGNNKTLSTTLYRNLAKISIKPSEAEDAFNDFTQEQLIISGLMNLNRVGKLVPYKDGSFYSNQNGTAPDYLTLPDNPNPLDKTPIGNEGAGYGYSLYVLEHDNPKDLNNGLFVICQIGGAYYKVALVDTNGEPYDIIRNHEYIIYVSDVDDYAYDTSYRADYYSDAFDKKPINLEVEEVVLQNVTFSPTEAQTVQMGNTLSITMIVPEGTTLNNFSISADGFNFNQPNASYNSGTTTFTFTPTSAGVKTITFTGDGENLNPVNTTIIVTVTEMPKVTFEYTDNQTLQIGGNPLTVTMKVPNGGTLNTLNISADGFEIKQNNNTIGTNNYSGNNLNYSNTDITYTFVPTSAGSKTITFSGSGNNLNVPQTIVNVTVQDVEKKDLQYSYGSTTLYLKDSNGNANPTSLDVTVTVPDGSILSQLNISASGFTIISSTEGLTGSDGNYSYTGGTNTTFTFTPTSAGQKTITFSGTNDNLIVDETIEVIVVDGNAPSEIVLWNEDIIVSWTAFELIDERLKDASEITLDVEVSDSEERQIQINMPGYLYISKESLPKNEKVTLTVSTTQSSMPPDGTLKITGQNVTITKIYIIPTSTP